MSRPNDIRLTRNFMLWEFGCQGVGCCNNSAPINPDFVKVLQHLREFVSGHVGQETPFQINSGFRCRTHNARIGGSKNSIHTYGLAADIRTPAIFDRNPKAFAKALEKAPNEIDALIIYDWGVHLDMRRWLSGDFPRVRFDNTTR